MNAASFFKYYAIFAGIVALVLGIALLVVVLMPSSTSITEEPSSSPEMITEEESNSVTNATVNVLEPAETKATVIIEEVQ